MLFTTIERLQLLQILPAEGNFLTLKITRELRESLSLSEEDCKVTGIKLGGETFVQEDGTEIEVPVGQIRWNDVLPPKEIEMGDKAKEVIVKTLKKLDKEEKLTQAHFSLCEKFMEEPLC